MQMPRIVPIRDLKNTTAISQICHEDKEPIFVTKNGYGDMVIMSMETYEKNLFLSSPVLVYSSRFLTKCPIALRFRSFVLQRSHQSDERYDHCGDVQD